MELFVLGLVVGGAVGAKGKGLVKTAAKGYLTLSEKARSMAANVREDMRDAVEEARYERELESALREEEAILAEADGAAEAADAEPARKRTTRKKSDAAPEAAGEGA